MRRASGELGVAVVIGMALSMSASAAPVCSDELGIASDYNVFVSNDFDLSTDVQGKVAAGGTATMSGFAVGHFNPGGNALVAGTIHATNGEIWGNAIYGVSGTFNTVTFHGGSPSFGMPINFGTTFGGLIGVSNTYAGLAANSTPTIMHYPGATLVNLAGTHPDLNIFSIDTSDLASLVYLRVAAPAGATVLVNVSGAGASLANAGFDVVGTDRSHVLFNFHEATALSMSGIGWKGSILAPHADVTLNNGYLDGTLIARSATGTGQWHHVPFYGNCDGTCGDGVVDPGEECDDGNNVPGDGCTACTEDHYCGDGVLDAGEACDDGNNLPGDGCSPTCTIEETVCGDGIVDPGEVCDDGNTSNNDECLNTCVPNVCGDGYLLTGGELCDDGNSSNTDACLDTCVPADCGDGYVWAGVEGCDDGNGDNTDACLDTCVPADCGDGYVWAGVEGCDDGNADNTDACLDTCVPADCGDGYVWAGVEGCDDGNGSNNDACLNTCTPNVCGDSYLWVGVEECDDGNTANEDGCDGVCMEEYCGDGIVQAGLGEGCDDGNTTDGDGCDAVCQPEIICIPDLGAAEPFNVFVFDSFLSIGSDVEGKAAGGNLVDMRSFAVGREDPGGLTVISDNLRLKNGTVYGDAVWGSLFNFDTATINGASYQDSPIDFATAQTELGGLSSFLGSLASTATPTVNHWGPVTYINVVVTDPVSNIVEIDAGELASSVGVRIQAPPGAAVLINVAGSMPTAGNFGFLLVGPTPQDLIWNFHQATTLTLANVSWKGTILAPFADVEFRSGNLDGQIIAHSLRGNAQYHQEPFDHVFVCP